MEVTSSTVSNVTAALKQAGERTGAGYDFLVKMAQRESSLNPAAKAKTSSAAGLFQFIEQTWLGAMKQYGERHGMSDYAADIKRESNGRFSVADANRRQQILNLRFDASASAALAGELASQNKSYLEGRLGREAGASDLYAAHFLGPAGAAKLLSADKSADAAALLPRAAAANKPVFYDGARAKTVGEVIASIAKSMGATQETPPAKPAITISAPQAAIHAKTLYSAVKDIAAPIRPAAPVETPTIATPVERKADIPTLSAQRLSSLALSVLQAIDPTRLTRGRDGDLL